MNYKKCNIHINHNGLRIHVTGIKKWDTENKYYDLRNDSGYIGFLRCEGLIYESMLHNNGDVIKFYSTVLAV